MKVRYRKSLLRDLRKTRDRQVLDRVAELLRTLERAESLSDISDVKPLAGTAGLDRVRIGDDRLGIAVQGDVVAVVRFLHRREVYRYFP